MRSEAGAPQPCGCCEGLTPVTPSSLENRPGLAALAYRVGAHWSFKGTMLSAFSGQAPLRSLTTREDDDPAVALVDTWATVLDVLTFYQERIANEGYLRTATEGRSVSELARSIGYEPNPGVAAHAYLAFELETTEGSPSSVLVEIGTKVQSVPGPGESAQVFETVEAIEARPLLNALRPQTSKLWIPNIGDREAHLSGLSTGLKPGDAVLMVGAEREGFSGSERWDFRLVKSVEPDQERQITRITWERGLGLQQSGATVEPAKKDVRFYALRERAGLFGYNAPDWRAMPRDVRRAYRKKFPGSGGEDWPGLSIQRVGADPNNLNPARTIYLDAVYPKVVPGSWLVLCSPNYQELYRADPELGQDAVVEASRTDFTMSARVTRVALEGENLAIFDEQVRDTVVFTVSEELPLAEVPVIDPVQGKTITLDSLVEGLERGRMVVMRGRRPRVRIAEGAHLSATTDAEVILLAPRDELDVLEPFTEMADGSRQWVLRTMDGLVVSVSAQSKEVVSVPAPQDAEWLAEAAEINVASTEGDALRTVLSFAQPLRQTYDRFSLAISANVAPATHGETKQQVLGSGDASRPFQTFALSQGPLTHVPAATPSGSRSTLSVRINDLEWQEVARLFGVGSRDRVYILRITEDGKVTVQFGDGKTGARVPTNVENVRAAYRIGIGKSGNLKEGQLSLLMTRPLGVKGVGNPLPSTGGADPESRNEVRNNAPRVVLTFDRVVSLKDYEDFSRSFGGIAKAQAAWLWDGETRLVHVSVAGIDGAVITSDSKTYKDLLEAIRDAGDPYQVFRVKSYEPVTFDVRAGVFLEPGYLWEAVRLAIVTALREGFSFDSRSLGQSVTESEVVAVTQEVPGVLAVDLDAIAPTGQPALHDSVLLANAARAKDGVLLPAQLLSLNPSEDGVVLSLRS